MQFKVKIRIILWLILASVIIGLLWLAIVPGGIIIYKKDFSKDNYFIRKFTPLERVEAMRNETQKIIGGPVYFSLRTPRRFDKGIMTLKYKNENDIQVLESGVLVDKTVWRYDLKPIENSIIDNLSVAWDVIREGEVIFLQKEKKYASLNDFKNNLPDLNTVALYNYDLKAPYILENYMPDDKEKIIKTSLRGAYEFFTYIKDEELDFNFSIIDLNKNKDSDEVKLFLYYENEQIDSVSLEDDGIAEDTGDESSLRSLNIKLNDLPEGVYKIEFKTNDDIATKEIKTTQQKLSFINGMWLYAQGESDINLYTNSKNIQARTINPDSLQVIRAGEKDLDINETYKLFSFNIARASTTARFAKVNIEKDGVIINGPGVFSFSPDAFLNPQLVKVDNNIDIIGDNINYVVARYRSPAEKDGWKIAQAEFDLGGAYRENGAYSFIISLPGLKADDGLGDYVEVDEIEIKLIGKRLIEKLKEIFTVINKI